MQAVERQTGKTPEQLAPVEFHYALRYIWEWFIDLSAGRGYSEVGPLPLTYTEIKAWSDLTSQKTNAWEIDILKQIDRVYITESLRK